MCGIAGILTGSGLPPTSLEELGRMAAILRHRGPDGYGLYRDDRVGLAHTRLSIIDVASGAQPIHNEDGSIWITFNGEIFNYLELRARLEGLGHRFYTRSDTEVIVHAYEQYGDQAWHEFNGQFAFALWDSRKRRLWLVRDPLGILPLHYAIVNNRLLFASESKALFASGHVRPRLSPQGVVQVFTRWAVSAPATVFEQVQSVTPGTALCFDPDLRSTRGVYWQPRFHEDPRWQSLNPDRAADALEERLTRAVQFRLRADVPVGAYLSGGLDSSVIASLIRRADSSPLQTFAIRFEDPAFDETVQQRRMAGLLGTQHHEILCGDKEIADALPEVVWNCETPLLRTAPVPLFLLSSLVRQSGMKVVLTGEGADEFLAGYHIFKEDKVRRFWARQPDSTWRPLLLSRLYPYVGPEAQRQSRMWQSFFGRGLGEVGHPFYSHLIRWRNTAWASGCLAPEVRDRFDPDCMETDLAAALPAGWRNWPPLARAQLIEIATFMSPYLLSCQGDRVAMAHGVEVRYPFLDPEVTQMCGQLPEGMRLRGLTEKAILRRVASRRLPREISERPKKPYRAPMTKAFFGEEPPDYVDELLSQQALTRFGFADRATAGGLIEKARKQGGRMSSEREEMALVGLLTLQLLCHLYTEKLDGQLASACQRMAGHQPNVLEDCASTPRPKHNSSPCLAAGSKGA